MTYETAYAELQKILHRVENGNENEALSLTEMEAALKRAAELVAFCKNKLHDTKNNMDALFVNE
jgi:exodeoxyribonuclease VII small subunit